jgi:Sulfotransferase family
MNRPRNIKEMLALGRISCENRTDQNASAKDLGPLEHMLNQLLQTLDSIAVAARVPDLPLNAEKLCMRALRTARRDAFRDRSFVEPMKVLFESYDREANLNVAGRYSARWDALRCLANLLRFDAEEERDNTILSQRIERPIFITGLPRSGTTLLHSLLAQDDAVRVPRAQDMIFPYPSCAKERDDRFAQVERQLRLFQVLAPEMKAMHPLAADGPQECTEITAQVFQSLRYEATHRVPSYQNWIDLSGHLAAYSFHKRFIQHLQHQNPGGRWILKSPDHIHAMGAIETVYPDNGIVFVHRDPVRVAASAMKLTEVIRRPFTRYIDRHEIGR